MAGERSNQKIRTRNALVTAARDLLRDGRPPSVPEAAERALVSVATAYRYFPSADELWWEAAAVELEFAPIAAITDARVEAAGDDPQARLEALNRSLGFWMLEEQVPVRLIARAGLDRWLRQWADPQDDETPSRQGRRNTQIEKLLEPLRDDLSEKDFERLARALGLIVGTEMAIALTDAVGLSVPEAKKTLLDAGRWLLAGALSDLDGSTPH